MTQVLDCASVARPSNPLTAWLARAAAFLRRDDGLIRPDTLSRHTLRDIGLGEDVRAEGLLSDPWLRR